MHSMNRHSINNHGIHRHSSMQGHSAQAYFNDLHQVFKGAVESSRRKVSLVAPFIRLKPLRYLLDDLKGVSVTVITSWHVDDVLSGVSDLTVFKYLVQKGWHLYVNNALHAKCVIPDDGRALFSSANITQKGLGLSAAANAECAIIIDPAPPGTAEWIDRLITASRLITPDVFEDFQRHVEEQQTTSNAVEDYDFSEPGGLTLSSLPMFGTPGLLIDCIAQIQKLGRAPAPDIMDRIIHDAQIFQLDTSKPIHGQRQHLKESFFGHPFVSEFQRFLGHGRFFGESKRWLQQTCTDSPKPYRRDLSGHVRILFDWMRDLSDGGYVIERPHYSERLTRVA